METQQDGERAVDRLAAIDNTLADVRQMQSRLKRERSMLVPAVIDYWDRQAIIGEEVGGLSLHRRVEVAVELIEGNDDDAIRAAGAVGIAPVKTLADRSATAKQLLEIGRDDLVTIDVTDERKAAQALADAGRPVDTIEAPNLPAVKEYVRTLYKQRTAIPDALTDAFDIIATETIRSRAAKEENGR